MKRLFTFAILFLLWIINDPSQAVNTPGRVILITIDTWRWDAIGISGSGKVSTPTIDSFAKNGLYIKKAWVSATMTTPSHASILTGMHPYNHGIRENHGFTLSKNVKSLAEVLKNNGYKTAAFVSGFPLTRQYGLDKGFDTYDDHLKPAGFNITFIPRERKGDETLRAVINWLENASKKYFLWIHFYDPHYPYTPPEAYNGKYKNKYYGEVAFVDSLIGQLKRRIELQGKEDLLWIICGDHGESLGEHGEQSHGLFVYDATARVPLIISGVGLSNVEGKEARLIDVMPTILDLCRIPMTEGLEGNSLFKKGKEMQSYTETLYAALDFGAAPVRSLSDGRFKVINVPKKEAYDLKKDPYEKTNIFGKGKNSQIDFLFKSIEKMILNDKFTIKNATSKEEERALTSLGYIGSTGNMKIGKQGMDPKDFLSYYLKIDKARKLYEMKKVSFAIPLYKSLLKDFPKSAPLTGELGLLYVMANDYKTGERYLQKAFTLNSEDPQVLVALGNIAIAKGDKKNAEKYYLKTLEIDPDDIEGNLNLGILYKDYFGDIKKAVPYFKHFLELVPDDPEAPKIHAIIKGY